MDCIWWLFGGKSSQSPSAEVECVGNELGDRLRDDLIRAATEFHQRLDAVNTKYGPCASVFKDVLGVKEVVPGQEAPCCAPTGDVPAWARNPVVIAWVHDPIVAAAKEALDAYDKAANAYDAHFGPCTSFKVLDTHRNQKATSL